MAHRRLCPSGGIPLEGGEFRLRDLEFDGAVCREGARRFLELLLRLCLTGRAPQVSLGLINNRLGEIPMSRRLPIMEWSDLWKTVGIPDPLSSILVIGIDGTVFNGI